MGGTPANTPREAPLRIGVTGSAGVGKTALAEALAQSLGVPLIADEMRAFVARRGVRAEAFGPAAVGRVLADLWAQRVESEGQRAAFVADRCAADFAAYALHHGAQDEAMPVVREALARADAYDFLFVLPWGGIRYVRDGVRSERPSEELRYQLVLESLLHRHAAARAFFVPPERRALEERMDFCLRALRRRRSRGAPAAPTLLTVPAAHAEALRKAGIPFEVTRPERARQGPGGA